MNNRKKTKYQILCDIINLMLRRNVIVYAHFRKKGGLKLNEPSL